jgi:hypothetical protein
MSQKQPPNAAVYSLEADDDEADIAPASVTPAKTPLKKRTNSVASKTGESSNATASTSASSAPTPASTGHGGGSRTKQSRQKAKRAVSFRKDLKSVMYGFGDEWNPLAESVDFMDQVVKEYIQGMVRD